MDCYALYGNDFFHRETEQKHQEHVNQLKHHMEEGFSEYKKQAEATICKKMKIMMLCTKLCYFNLFVHF